MPRNHSNPPPAVTQVRAHRWFVTTRLAERRLVKGEVQLVPTTTVHAKRMGTNRTVCGLDTTTWHKLWEQRFTGAGRDVCPACALEVIETQQAS
jgi:hypothetical protein